MMQTKRWVAVGAMAFLWPAVCAAAGSTASTTGEAAPRPAPRSIGIGMGFSGAIDIFAPTTAASVRFRLSHRTAIEPSVSVQFASVRQRAGTTSSDKEYGAAFNLLLRHDFASRDRADFVGILGAGVATNTTHDTIGAPVRTTNESVNATWGLGVETWPGAHWSISADVLNPIVTFGSSQTTPTGGAKSTATTVTGGLFFQPSVRVMTHLYF